MKKFFTQCHAHVTQARHTSKKKNKNDVPMMSIIKKKKFTNTVNKTQQTKPVKKEHEQKSIRHKGEKIFTKSNDEKIYIITSTNKNTT
jgi:hypothetical protein